MAENGLKPAHFAAETYGPPKGSTKRQAKGMSVAGLNPEEFSPIPTDSFGKSLRGAVKHKK